MRGRIPPIDWLIVAIGVVGTEAVALRLLGIGNPIAGPRPLVLALPLLLALPLAWRRIYPLASELLVLGGFLLQAVVSGNAAQGAEMLYAAAFATYSVGAYASRRRAFVGLAAWVGVYVVEEFEDPSVRSGPSGQLWSSAFFGLVFVAVWLLGVWTKSRREAAAAEREAATAVAEERARMARELHDIVSHKLSVVVLQAAGARAAGAGERTLEKIENSGREALVEMRRLLGVLRHDGNDDALAPQPGIAQLERLASDLRAAGLPVDLDVDDGCDSLPPALQLNAYRIIQEALTNVLKHAGSARAHVHVGLRDGQLLVEVRDDGTGPAEASLGGHGLVGMRERVALFGGDLRAESRPEGGFAVHATLPLQP
jgi:signal transduction histidine kinase